MLDKKSGSLIKDLETLCVIQINEHMKSKSLLILIASVIVIMSMTLRETAPTARIGYASSGFIMKQLPETKVVVEELDTLQKQFSEQFNEKIMAYQEKLQAFKKNEQSMNELVKADKEEELKSMQASIAKFQQQAEQALKQKEQELMKPVYEKVQSAIDKTAKEYGYTHILNIDSKDVPLMLYAEKGTRVDSLIINFYNKSQEIKK